MTCIVAQVLQSNIQLSFYHKTCIVPLFSLKTVYSPQYNFVLKSYNVLFQLLHIHCGLEGPSYFTVQNVYVVKMNPKPAIRVSAMISRRTSIIYEENMKYLCVFLTQHALIMLLFHCHKCRNLLTGFST